MSEEGAECTNKVLRHNREHHARQSCQSSVGKNLLDVFTRYLLLSKNNFVTLKIEYFHT